MPKVNREYMLNEMPDVSFVLIDFMACGIKEIVVDAAAINPVMVTIFMKNIFCFDRTISAKYFNQFMNN